MRTAHSLSRVWLVLLTMFMATTAVFAEAPKSPVDFNAAVMTAPNGGAKFVKLYWYMAQDGDLATHFDIYMAKGETEDMSLFDKIATVNARDNEPRGKYMFEIDRLEPGIYTFFVIAVNDDGSSERTRIRVVKLEDKPIGDKLLKFVTEPKRVAVVGTAYRYEAKAKGFNVEGGVTYDLTHGPDGMTIDANTGLVSWDEPKAGRYEIRIVAKLITADGTELKAVQEYVIEVKGEEDPKPEACVTVSGSVTYDNTDDLVAHGVIIAWLTKGDDPANSRYEPVFKAEIREGRYTMKLPAGTYKLRIEGASFMAEWHENVHELADATTITLTCDAPEHNINFSVAPRAEVKLFVVSGRITDAATGEGLKGLVKFDARLKTDVNIEHGMLHRVAETNAEGYYEVKLPEGIAFIAFADSRAPANTISPYIGEFWQETGDVTAATQITLTDNVGDINFTLDRRGEFDNSIHGRLINHETEAAVKGKATAYLVKSVDRKELDRRWSATVETDDEGHYAFTNLIPGKYIILGTPAERPLAPGWYLDNAAASFKWQDATQIEVTEDSKNDGYVVRLTAIKGEHGRGKIRGWVFNKRGGIVAPIGNVKSNEQVQGMEENGIIGALVVATVNGEVVDYTFSENDGAYELASLGIGDAVLNINRFDFDNVSANVTVDDGARIEQQMSFGLDAVVSGVEVPVDRVGKDIGLYPNPANSAATVSFTATAGTAVIKVVDMTGVVLFTNTLEVPTGEVSTQLNLSTVPAGMVMVHVSNGTSAFALPLSILR